MASSPCRRCGSTEKYKNGRCAPCDRKNALAYWRRHPERKRALKQQMRMLLNEKRNRPCADCGNRFPPCAMDFDHVRGMKTFTIASRPTQGVNQILKEIAKCDVVCANCHRIRTWNRSHDWLEQV